MNDFKSKTGNKYASLITGQQTVDGSFPKDKVIFESRFKTNKVSIYKKQSIMLSKQGVRFKDVTR